MPYQWIKYLHVFFAISSVGLFLLRLHWRQVAPHRLQLRWVRILPHVNDSLLLLAGLTLMARLQAWPWQTPWLAAKMLALGLYILAGMWAFRARGKAAVAAAMSALLVFFYMVAVAVSKQALPGI
ncbi:hypothetical protein A11A3_15759 [Alcanivorax hongdengensis A-11-3]|uniref:Invasion gene expression up-regulator SirB n=1 Tax=Alcanivorax hongdengensis A-11-3 TaxID=1177179 RepID=L0W7Z0_9GAMM|nr:SirB2 family protein [Alcanivorax hongdengensis]EKF73021.1 hypothetical protein A11A3_15759 [Alcanivorax hongdengensis A-11-3]